jgi:transposase
VKPKDKAKVEVGVQLVQRWILAVLRHRTFFSLQELNEAIGELLTRLNEKPFKKMEGSRRSAFETIDKPALKPLPPERYQFARWYRVRVNQDYHVRVEDNHYSVPYQLVRQEVEARVTDGVVEVLFRGRRVSSHRRLSGKGKVSTNPRHQPASHRRYAEWTPSRVLGWSESVGPNTHEMVDLLMKSRPHPEQGFRSCMGLVSLGKKYPPERLEAACGRALALKIISYKSVRSMLQSGLDRVSLDEDRWEVVVQHENVRGPEYYAPSGKENCDDEPTYPGPAARDAAAGDG